MIVCPHWEGRLAASLIQAIRPQTCCWQSKIRRTRFSTLQVPSVWDASAFADPIVRNDSSKQQTDTAKRSRAAETLPTVMSGPADIFHHSGVFHRPYKLET